MGVGLQTTCSQVGRHHQHTVVGMIWCCSSHMLCCPNPRVLHLASSPSCNCKLSNGAAKALLQSYDTQMMHSPQYGMMCCLKSSFAAAVRLQFVQPKPHVCQATRFSCTSCRQTGACCISPAKTFTYLCHTADTKAALPPQKPSCYCGLKMSTDTATPPNTWCSPKP